MISLDTIHEVTAVIGDVAVVATATGALAAGVGKALGSFGFLPAEAVCAKIASGCAAVGVDIQKFLATVGGFFGSKKAAS
jgi:hypothetical protein